MVGLTKSRKLRKKRIKYNQQKALSIKLPNDFSTTFVWTSIILILLIFGTYFILKYTLFEPNNYIRAINYSQSSIDDYDNPYLYKKITETLTGENFYIIKYFRNSKTKEGIISEYPIIQDIRIYKQGPMSAFVELDFYQPDIVITFQDKEFGVLGEHIFPLFSGNSLGNGIMVVDLPNYLSGIQNINGIFYDIGAENFKTDLYQIDESFPQAERIVYLPGSLTTVVFVYGKMVYINHQDDIKTQIENFYLLDKYYDKFDQLKVVDLGSLDLDKIIVKE